MQLSEVKAVITGGVSGLGLAVARKVVASGGQAVLLDINDEAGAAFAIDVDYWSIGSIYTTASKSDAGAPIGIGGFKGLARLAPEGMPVIAIGGIEASNARPVLEAGADGVAVISAVFGATDIEGGARRLRDIVDEVRRS